MKQTVADIAQRLAQADEEQFAVLERALAADSRKGVKQALARARRRLDAEAALAQQTDRLYRFQQEAALSAIRMHDQGVHGGEDSAEPQGDAPESLAVPAADEPWVCAVGLDEVGRGPIAGPLTVGAVVLPPTPQIVGLNDSKQLTPARREELDAQIRQTALAWDIEHIPPKQIDERGMAACLKTAFSRAVAAIDAQLPGSDAGDAGDDADDAAGPVRAVLLDGNPLHIDKRELSLVKGDGRVAAIAAASIIAKVARDRLMVEYAAQYPAYAFDENKGYGSAAHIAAIQKFGLTPIHRKSFCHNFYQESLF